jgi:hypothetical protein
MIIQNRYIAASFFALTIACTASPALAQFGALLGGGGAAKQTAGDPDAFLKSAQSAEKLMRNSVTLLARGLSSKEKAAELEANRNAANAITNPEEKKAKLLEVSKQEQAAANEALNNSKMADDIKKMDSAKKEQVSGAAFNFMLALLQDKDLVGQASGLISSLSSNPMNISKVGGIKDVAASLQNQITDASQVAGKMSQLFSAVGVTAPASKDEKPKTTAAVAGD